MKYLLVFSFWLLVSPLFAQTPPKEGEKGATPLPTHHASLIAHHSTRAVVVGISDYQHNDISDLNFAAADARAFADWLRSPAGGSVPEDHVILLTDKNATLGNFAMALDGLVDDCKEGDQAIIYFSGHGDVERKMITQPGYLLCRDAPAICYMGGGAFNLRDLQLVVSTLSLQNKARVVVITDACHAGKLAGNAIGGVQITGKSLAELFANEVKIMSCQPNELSLEGEQWGGGHGVFSYHLVRGMTGLADRNSDGQVTLFEIGRYLEDVVPADVAPMSQMPQIAGEKQTVVSRVDASSLAVLQKEKKDNILIAAGAKGLEDDVLAKTDSSGRQQYFSFKAALVAGNLLEPADACANFFHARLVANETFGPLAGLITRNLAAALIDEVQQALNALLDNDPYENNNWYFHPEKFSRYPAYLDRAVELLGEKHYLAASLLSKKAYFEGYAIAKTKLTQELKATSRDSLREAARHKYLEAIRLEPDAAYLYFAIGDLYFANNPQQTDSLLQWCQQAIDRSPAWVTPMLEIAYEYQSVQQRIDLEEQWLLEAQRILPNSYLVMERLAWLRQWQGRRDDAVEMCRKMIALKPDLFNGYATLANTIFVMDGDFKEAEKYARKAIEVFPEFSNWGYHVLAPILFYSRKKMEAIDLTLQVVESKDGDKGLGYLWLTDFYGQTGEYEKADRFARKMIVGKYQAYWQTEVLLNLGKVRVRQKRFPEAIALFEKSLKANAAPDACFVKDWAWLGEVSRLQNRPADAEAYFQKALTYSSGSVWEEMANKDEAHYLYGNFLLRLNRLTEAREQFQKSLDIRKKGFWGEYGFALLAARQGKTRESLDWLERSLDNYFPEAKPILEEPLFKKLRKTKRFRELMAKHFPATAKQ